MTFTVILVLALLAWAIWKRLHDPERLAQRVRQDTYLYLQAVFYEGLGWAGVLKDYGPKDQTVFPWVEFDGTTLARIAAPVPTPFHPNKQEHVEAYLDARVPGEWAYEWDLINSQLHMSPKPEVPEDVVTGPGDVWHLIHIGSDADGPVYWDLKAAPHLLIVGGTGSGKSTAINSILGQILDGELLHLVAIDPKMVSFVWAKDHPWCEKITIKLEESTALLEAMLDEQSRRLNVMASHGVEAWYDLPEDVRFEPILIAIDEVAELFIKPPGASVQEIEQRKRCASAILRIAQMGRAAGFHLLCATQRIDGNFFGSRIRENFLARLACGRIDTEASETLFGSDLADRPVKRKGQGTWFLNGNVARLQIGHKPWQ